MKLQPARNCVQFCHDGLARYLTMIERTRNKQTYSNVRCITACRCVLH